MKSQIYLDWDGTLLDDTSKAFQSLIIARDGIFIKKHSGHRLLNFKLVLLAAQKTMPTRDFRLFKDQMERALKETNKAYIIFSSLAYSFVFTVLCVCAPQGCQ